MASRAQSLLPHLFMLAFNAPVLVLKVLRTFDVPRFHMQYLDSVDLGDIPAWQKIEKLLRERGI
jgi:hypothetical protein